MSKRASPAALLEIEQAIVAMWLLCGAGAFACLPREAGCTTELDYTEQTSWLLFLKYLDGLEQDKSDEARLHGKKYTYILDAPYRWEARRRYRYPLAAHR